MPSDKEKVLFPDEYAVVWNVEVNREKTHPKMLAILDSKSPLFKAPIRELRGEFWGIKEQGAEDSTAKFHAGSANAVFHSNPFPGSPGNLVIRLDVEIKDKTTGKTTRTTRVMGDIDDLLPADYSEDDGGVEEAAG